MWYPKSVEEFETAVLAGALDESHDFDAKQQLPKSGKELAKDVAAMTTDGGMLVYGVGEDEQKRPRVLAPIELAGAPERIDQIAQTSITGSFKREFVRLDRSDGHGYLLVLIPPSPDAPHQVTVGGDRRFYGRSDTGNRLLSEEEIARLYERRRSQQLDREQLLAECLAWSPYRQPTPGKNAYLQAFVRPVVLDDDVWDRAMEAAGSESSLHQSLLGAVDEATDVRWGGWDLGSARRWDRRGADTWSLDTTQRVAQVAGRDVRADEIVRADVGMDGHGFLFYGGAGSSDRRNAASPEMLVVYEIGLARTLAQFVALMGRLFDLAEYYGSVDVGMAVTGLRGAVSSRALAPGRFMGDTPVLQDDRASRALRFDARDLAEDPREIVRRLTGRLMRALDGREFDPLATA